MTGHEDKRAFERFPTDMSIWIRPEGQDGDYILVEIANISAGGILFGLDYAMENGTL